MYHQNKNVTCDGRSKHDTQSTEEHQDPVGLSQTIHSHDLSGHVGDDGPVPRKKAQHGRDDLQPGVVLGEGDKDESHPGAQQGEGVQEDAVHPPNVHDDS